MFLFSPLMGFVSLDKNIALFGDLKLWRWFVLKKKATGFSWIQQKCIYNQLPLSDIFTLCRDWEERVTMECVLSPVGPLPQFMDFYQTLDSYLFVWAMIRIFLISYLRPQIMSVYLISFYKPNYMKKNQKKNKSHVISPYVCVCVRLWLSERLCS